MNDRTTTIDVARDREFGDQKTVLPTEYARAVVVENAPSAQALKIAHLMIATAGGRMADDTWHEIKASQIKKIKGMRKPAKKTLAPLFLELRKLTYHFDDKENSKLTIGGFLDYAEIDYAHDETGDLSIKWQFSFMFKKMAEKSQHWAILDRQTVFALRSRYSILLFQYLSSLFNLKYKSNHSFTIEELRSVLNIEAGKVTRFSTLNQKILKPVLAEINHLSRFTIKMDMVKSGRTVTGVNFSWSTKEDTSKTKAELDASKVGRKVRQAGTADKPVMSHPFPASGGLSLDKFWLDEGKRIWSDTGKISRDFPDTKLIADHVRKKISEQGMSLDDMRVTKLFENVIKAWR